MAKTEKKVKEDNQKDVFQEKLKSLEAKYGSGTVIHGKDILENLEVVSTGSLTLDIATNLGGLPLGKLIEIFGMESSGKSTLTLHAIANFQKLEGNCILLDYEHSFDRVYATAIGIDVDKLTIIQPDCMEDGYNIAEELIKTGEVRLIILDSHTAAIPKVVIEGQIGESKIAPQARINSVALGKIKPLLKPNRCTMIAISQIRNTLTQYGDPNQPTGGYAYKFYSDMRIKVNKTIDGDNEKNKTTAVVIKNKCASPFGKAEFGVLWGKGVDRLGELIDLASEYLIIQKSGSWYSYGDYKIGQGADAVRQLLVDNPEYAADIECKLLDKIKMDK